MNLYHKIQSIYKRDPQNKYRTFLDGQFSVPAFGLLKDLDWAFTEKVDGTNIRIGWDDVAKKVSLGGRGDNSQLPGQLRIYMENHFTPEFCAAQLSGPVTLIGEGYGGKIQKGSGYQLEQRFILFDVFIEPYEDAPQGLFLDRRAVESIALDLGIPVVPVIYTGPLLDGLDLVRDGMSSQVSDTELQAEGVVARPNVELCDYMGRRIITKIKVRDFE